MSKKRQAARQAIPETSDFLISEISEGKWDHHQPPLNSIPVEEWEEVIQEFTNRCPGLTRNDYVDALRRSQFQNR